MSTRHSHWTSAAHSFNIHNSRLETLSLASGGDGSQIITLSSIVLLSPSGQYYHKADEDKTLRTGSRMCDKMCPPLKTIAEVHRVWIYLFNIIMEHQRQPSFSSSAIDDPCLSLSIWKRHSFPSHQSIKWRPLCGGCGKFSGQIWACNVYAAACEARRTF